MTKVPKILWTFNFYKSEWWKQEIPTDGWKLVSCKKTWYRMYILKFEKTYTNG
jgi:hypothetical protein